MPDSCRFDNYEASPEKPVQRYKPPPAPKRDNPPRQCKFCDQVFEASEGPVKDKNQNQMGKLRRHVLMHFKDKLQLLLPKQRPWECPMPNCDHVAKAQIDLTSHYAFTHDMISDYCSKEDILGIPLPMPGSADSSAQLIKSMAVSSMADRPRAQGRDNDYNNNYERILAQELEARKERQRRAMEAQTMGKSEEEKRFDFALSSAVSKVSFWFVNGNIDKEDLNNGVAKLGSSRYRGKKGSYEKMHTLESDEEDKFGKTVPDLSKAIGDRLNAKANAQMQMKERIAREEAAQQQREMLRNDKPENHSRARAEFLQGRTEEVQENSRSILNSIIGASAPLAPPRQTFSMDPFGQKNRPNPNRSPPSAPPGLQKSGSLLSRMHPANRPNPEAYNPKPNQQRGAYVDPFEDRSPGRQAPNQQMSKQERQNMEMMTRDSQGNYSCRQCGFASKLRVQVIKHNCEEDSE